MEATILPFDSALADPDAYQINQRLHISLVVALP
jgi:hypothetical protein